MAKIKMKISVSMVEIFDDFLLMKKSMGLSEKTLRTYKEHLRAIGRHLPIDKSMDLIEKADLERMISSMHDVGLAANSIQSYSRTLKSFFSWCNEEGITNLNLSRYKAEETIKDTYAELTVKPGEDNIFYSVRLASNLYYHRVTLYNAETGEQLAQATLHSLYFR